MFQDREDAARQLAEKLKGRELHDPLVLAIPRGGVVTGAVLARELDAELDVVLSRKLRHPWQPELALGAVSESGHMVLNPQCSEEGGFRDEYLHEERSRQLQEIARRSKLFRAVRPQSPIAGRTVIVTDDGVATGATMLAALQSLKEQHPREVIVAAPVASPDRLVEVRRWCDEVVCLLSPPSLWAIGQFYRDFTPVEDSTVVELLRAEARTAEAKLRG
jgi:putative phosphoribosyl transferase